MVNDPFGHLVYLWKYLELFGDFGKDEHGQLLQHRNAAFFLKPT